MQYYRCHTVTTDWPEWVIYDVCAMSISVCVCVCVCVSVCCVCVCRVCRVCVTVGTVSVVASVVRATRLRGGPGGGGGEGGSGDSELRIIHRQIRLYVYQFHHASWYNISWASCIKALPRDWFSASVSNAFTAGVTDTSTSFRLRFPGTLEWRLKTPQPACLRVAVVH